MERKRQMTGWRVLGVLGTAVAVGVGIAANLFERQRISENNAYIDAQISASCGRLEPAEDRVVCETNVAEYFGREN